MTLFLTLELIIKETFRGLFFVYISAYFVEKVCPNVSKRGVLAKRKTCKLLKINYLQVISVPRAGVEPARVAPLVFETSASTDSAIWAKKRPLLKAS